MELPESGASGEEVRTLLTDAATGDMPWRDGRGWSLVFDLPGDHHDLVQHAMARFSNENALSYSAFPSASTFESSVISMVASVLNPGTESFGVFTSGGTESILQAVKAHRDVRPRSSASIVVPETAHPAFGKAAQLLGISALRVRVGDSGAVDPTDVIAAIRDDTVMIALSAPNFPFGVIDPIEEVAAAAQQRGVGVHVDAALGGLFLPFLASTHAPVPIEFGLNVAGVTSVSVDLHKYGYGAKGASVLLFSSEGLRHASYYVDASWPGGAYAASGALGTRPVGPSAAAFTSLTLLGREGFRARVADIMHTTALIQGGLREVGLEVIGAPPMSVFAASGETSALKILMKGLKARGWWIDAMTLPPALHFMVFPRHASVVETFLHDLHEARAHVDENDADIPISSYGVMVRDGIATQESLWAHLDRRFDGNPLTGP